MAHNSLPAARTKRKQTHGVTNTAQETMTITQANTQISPPEHSQLLHTLLKLLVQRLPTDTLVLAKPQLYPTLGIAPIVIVLHEPEHTAG